VFSNYVTTLQEEGSVPNFSLGEVTLQEQCCKLKISHENSGHRSFTIQTIYVARTKYGEELVKDGQLLSCIVGKERSMYLELMHVSDSNFSQSWTERHDMVQLRGVSYSQRKCPLPVNVMAYTWFITL
jgi:hypothetical protein